MALIKLNNQSYSSLNNFLPTDSIIQTKYYQVITTATTTTSTSFTNLGSSFNFTPLSTSSNIFITVSTDSSHDSGSDGIQFRLNKDGTTITTGDNDNRIKYHAGATLNTHAISSWFEKISNTSTNQITFQLQFKTFDAGTARVGSFGDTAVLIKEIKA